MTQELELGTFIGDKFTIGTTDVNEYFPYYAKLSRRSETISEYVTNDVYLYYKPGRINEWAIGRYPDLFQYLRMRLNLREYRFTILEERHSIYVMQGYISDKDKNILLLLTTNTLNPLQGGRYMMPDKLRLYISTELIKNPIYKNLYKKLQKEYIDALMEEGVDVLYTTSKKIEDSIFKNEFEITFDSLTELTQKLHTEPQEILSFVETSMPDPSSEDEVPF